MAVSFVGVDTTAWASTTSQNVTVTSTAGNLLIHWMAGEHAAQNLTTPTGGGGFTLDRRNDTDEGPGGTKANQSGLEVSHGTSTGNFTATATTSPAFFLGSAVAEFAGFSGIGATAIAANATSSGSGAAQSLNITTANNGSGLFCVIADWTAADFSASTTYATINGLARTQANNIGFLRNASAGTTVAVFYDDVGVAGVKTFSVAKTSTVIRTVIILVEINAAAGAATSLVVPPRRQLFQRGLVTHPRRFHQVVKPAFMIASHIPAGLAA